MFIILYIQAAKYLDVSELSVFRATNPIDSVTGVTILLSLTVFLNLVAETLPQVSDAIPLLGTQGPFRVA